LTDNKFIFQILFFMYRILETLIRVITSSTNEVVE
jgi:hypothetical protein